MFLFVILTKACCLGPRAEVKTIDYGIIEDSVKAYLPYKDSSFISFLDTNNLKVEYKIERYSYQQIMQAPLCKFCCKQPRYTYKGMIEDINISTRIDSTTHSLVNIRIRKFQKNEIEFYCTNYFELKLDSLNLYEKISNVMINDKSYNNVFKLKPRYSNDTSEYLLFNKEFGVLKINYKSGKSFSLLSKD